MSDITLYDYPLSSASYRVRIALNLANLPYTAVKVNLLEKVQQSDEHLARNPQGFVPVLEIDGHRFTQSLAIIEYLDETRALGLLPSDPALRAKARALAYAIAVDLHPVCNLSVVAHATNGEEPARTNWMRHFIAPRLAAFETLLEGFDQAPFATGADVSLADLCLIPQIYNADRWGAEYSDCRRIKKIVAACHKHSAFVAGHPDYVVT